MTVEQPGFATFEAASIKGVRLSSLVRVTHELEPRTVSHVDRQRVIELEWEAGDGRGLLDRVKKALDGIPSVAIKLVD